MSDSPYTPPAASPPPLEEKQQNLSSDELTMGMLCHLLLIITGFIGPLVVWLVKKDESKFVDHHGKEALNFLITVIIALVVSWLLCFILIGFVLLPAVGITALVFEILATVAAQKGEWYRYPFCIRFIP